MLLIECEDPFHLACSPGKTYCRVIAVCVVFTSDESKRPSQLDISLVGANILSISFTPTKILVLLFKVSDMLFYFFDHLLVAWVISLALFVLFVSSHSCLYTDVTCIDFIAPKGADFLTATY